MAQTYEKIIGVLSRNLVWAGAGLGLGYWVIEASIHVYLFQEGTLYSQVFNPSVHEIWMRMIVAFLLVTFSLYGQVLLNQLRHAQAAVAEREQESALILENNPAAIIMIDTETRKISYANTNAQNMVGATVDRILGHACHKFLCPAQQGKCPVLDLGQDIDISERPLLTSQGETVPVLKSVAKVEYLGREHLLEAFFDIREQRRMGREIRKAHAEMDQIFQTASVGMRVIDHNFNILKVNHAFSELSGTQAGSAVGKKCYDIFAGSMCHTPDCPLVKILDGETHAEYEVSKKRADDSPLNCILTATRFDDPGGNPAGIVESFKDVTELKKTQQFLESERDKLHRILFHQFESVGIVNADYELEYQNELLESQTGGVAGINCYRVFRGLDKPCDNCLMHKAIATGKTRRFEFDTPQGRSYQHTYTPFMDTDGGKKAVISQRDITKRKASMAAAIRSEHLAAIGELAAGVAHEINNPITGIINYGQVIVNRTDDDEFLNNVAGRIVKEGDRIAVIVKTLLGFARRNNEKKDLVRIQDLIEDSLTLTRAQLLKDGIHLHLDLDDNLAPIPARAQEIQQVFVNLISNSRYALNEKYKEEHASKRLDITVRMIADSGNSRLQARFRDQGIGIPPENLEKIAHPFYSTKPKGKGTGLGLSISQRIIENHGGKLSVGSQAGGFTEVVVELPATIPSGLKDVA